MESTNKWKKAGFSTIFWAVVAAVLCAAPPIQADVTVPAGEEWEINYDVGGFLTVNGTANLDTGFYAAYGIYANGGSTINILGGNVGSGYAVNVSTDLPAPFVTVYGTGFVGTQGGNVDGTSFTTSTDPQSEYFGTGVLQGTYGNVDPINLLFISSVPITLADQGTANLPPVALAGQEGLIGPGGKIHPIYSSEQSTTEVLGQASDPEDEPIEYRWLEGSDVLQDWTAVATPPEAYLDLSTLAPFSLGDHILTLEVHETTGDPPLTSSDDMTLRILGSLTIDIKPGSYPNSINLGSNGVIPVAILSTADFDATLIPANTVFLAGAGVAVRGKGKNTLAHQEDVNDDGFMDLVVKVEIENLDSGTFQNGGAFLQIRETSNPTSPIIDEGWDEITIVP